MMKDARVLTSLVLALVLSGRITAQEVSAPTLKAEFLYNLAKFTYWPSGALIDGQPLSLCVIGDDGVAQALERTTEGQEIRGHELTVTILKSDGPASSCHLLYISPTEITRAAALLTSIRRSPVSTVSDADKFAESGGIVQLIVEKDRIRFSINLVAGLRAKLGLSWQMFRLAETMIKERPDAGH